MSSHRLRRFLGATAAGLVALAAACLCFGIIVGFFGAFVPLFDTAGQFRGHASVALFGVGLLLIVCRLRLAGIASLGVACVGLAGVLPLVLPQGAPPSDGPHYTLLQMNLRYDAPEKLPAIRLIAALGPDVVTLQEVTPQWQNLFATLRERYPYQFYCGTTEETSDTAILSRRPFVADDPGICDVWGGLSARKIDFNGSAMTIATVHMRWPWPGRQWRQIEAITPHLSELRDPVLIAGDFNSAPWSASVRRVAAISGTRILPGVGPSWFVPALPASAIGIFGLPIDNVLASASVDVLRIHKPEPTGSDHLPVLIEFTTKGMGARSEPEVRAVAK